MQTRVCPWHNLIESLHTAILPMSACELGLLPLATPLILYYGIIYYIYIVYNFKLYIHIIYHIFIHIDKIYTLRGCGWPHAFGSSLPKRCINAGTELWRLMAHWKLNTLINVSWFRWGKNVAPENGERQPGVSI